MIIDNELTFKPHIQSKIIVINNSLWRLYNHSHNNYGLDVFNLNIIFKSYILPHFSYGCSIWLYKIFDHISLDQKPNYGYANLWNNLNTLYMKSAKCILGCMRSSHNLSVLIILGWLPLRYELCYISICWYFRIVKNDTDTKKLHDHFFLHDDYSWVNSIGFKKCYDKIIELNFLYNNTHNTNITFLDLKLAEFKSKIKQTMYIELTNRWNVVHDKYKLNSDHTFKYLKQWNYKTFISSNVVKKIESMYYQLFLSYNFTLTSKHHDDKNNKLCRRCGLNLETVDHVIKYCKYSFFNYAKIDNSITVKHVLNNYKKKIQKYLSINYQ